jgi:hypothetical protein
MEEIKYYLEFIEKEAQELTVAQDYELTKYIILKHIYKIKEEIRQKELE